MKRAKAGTWIWRCHRIGIASTAAIGLIAATSAAAYAAPRAVGLTTGIPHAGVEVADGGSPVRPDAAAPPPKASGTPKTFRLYATREGLVGNHTANGHTVVKNDHFVSLPSTLSLSAKGKNYYSVRVCAVSNGRCAYEPVWDVGPWNTHDDYWNADRANGLKLPVGTPEAQAAFQDGFNGGRDQFGRKVLNPSGIDLADGTVWQGLARPTSNWVKVTFLWTGGGIRASISTNGGTVNVRQGPATTYPVVGLAGAFAQIPIECKVKGQIIVRARTFTKTWYRMQKGNYISAAFVSMNAAKVPSCSTGY